MGMVRFNDAKQFFDKCLNRSISLHEVDFKENRKATSSKLDVLNQLLQYRHVKIYRIGNKDLVTENNRFEMALGNYFGIIGFDKRNRNQKLAVPVTVMKKPITDYISSPRNLLAVLMKSVEEKKYSTTVGQISSSFSFCELPDYIKWKIEDRFFTVSHA